MAEPARVGKEGSPRPRRLAWGRALVLLAGLGGAFACGEDMGQPLVGSETHFLTRCSGSCPGGAECLCGVCTKSCAASSECHALGAEAACVSLAPRSAEVRCDADVASVSMCDVPCLGAGDCKKVGPTFECYEGYCRAEPVPSAEPPAACAASGVSGADVMVLGDALIQLSTFTADLEQAASSAGVLAAGDHYRNYASSLYSILATGPLGVQSQYNIQNQYTMAKADGAARIVVMDGGETDVLNVPCGSAPTPDCPAVQAAAAGAETLFANFAADGVEHVVYFFYGDPVGNVDVKAGLDVLRPFVENACGRAALPCHFIDLRPVFADHPEYAAADGLVFSDSGAQAAATAVFDLMQERCIAQ